MDNKNLKSLYDGLIKKGYSKDEIGDEATFNAKMADKNNRRQLFDYVSKRGDFRIGDYDSYEKRLAGTEPVKEEPSQTGTQPAEQLPVQDDETAVEQPKRKTLEQQAGMGIAMPDASEMAAKFAAQPVLYNPKANIDKALASGKLDTIINEDEERNIDSVFTPAQVKKAEDIYANYADRFALTSRGKELSAELADIQRRVQEKYANEFLASDDFRKLKEQYKGKELDDAANKAFSELYGKRIEEELSPYADAYRKEAYNRYEGKIAADVKAYQEEQRKQMKDKVASDVSSLQQSVTEQQDKLTRSMQQKAGSGGNAMSALMGSRAYITGTESERKSMSELSAAQNLIEESQNIIDEAKRKGNTNFVAGLGRGFAQEAFNPDTWSFGLVEMRDSKLLIDALDRFDRGEELTDSQKALMDAAVANMATNAYFYSDLGRGYKAGTVSGQSVPFMLEFAINPVSASGSTIAKNILKYGMKKFGKQAVKNNAAKFAARLTGDAAAAAAMTGTTGAARVAGGTLERMGGDIKLDETGTEYAGRTGQQGVGEALGKSFASTFLENQSEMVFNAFKGIGPMIWSKADKLVPGGAAGIIDNAIMGKAGAIWRKIKSDPVMTELAKRTQFHGLGEEYLEEVYNNFANIPLGEMTLEEATDLDNNIDTFLGLAPTSVAFAMLGAGGLAAEKIRHRRRMQAALGNMERAERERLAELERMAGEAGNEDIKEFIRATIEDKDLTPEQKKEEIAYAYNLAVGNAIDEAEAERDTESVEAKERMMQEGRDIYTAHDPAEMRRTVVRREMAEESLQETGLQPEEIESLRNAKPQERASLIESLPQNTWDAARTYLDALDREEGLNAALDDAHAAEWEESTRRVEGFTLPNNTVTLVSLGHYSTDTAQYGIVVSGIGADGSPTQSKGRMMVYPVPMLSDGTFDFSAADENNPIAMVPDAYADYKVFTPDDVLEAMNPATTADEMLLEPVSNAPGNSFGIMLDDGTVQNVVVSANDGSGRIAVVLPDGKATYMDEADLNRRKLQAERLPLMQEQSLRQQEQAEAVRQAVTADVDAEVAALQPQPDETIVTSDGRKAVISEVTGDGIDVIYTNDNGEMVGIGQLPLEEYYQYKQKEYENAKAQTNAAQSSQGNAADTTGTEQAEMGAQPSAAGTAAAGTSAPAASNNPQIDYPKDESGEPIFSQMQPQQTVSVLQSMLQDDAPAFAAAKLQEAQKAAEKAAKKSPKATSLVQRVTENEQIRKEREEASRNLAYWQEIAGMFPSGRKEEAPKKEPQQQPSVMEAAQAEYSKNQERISAMSPEEIAARQEAVQRKIDSGAYSRPSAPRKRTRYDEENRMMGEAYTPMEHVLREIATGNVVFLWGNKGNTKGLGAHLGLSDSEAERKKHIWAISSEGLPPEMVAEEIHADMPSWMQDRVTDMDVFGMILDAFQTYGTPSRMWEEAKRLHGVDNVEQEDEADIERRALQWEAEANRMTVDEWVTYNDIVEEELTYMLRTLSDEDINGIFEQFINEQEDEQRRNQAESAESTQQPGDTENGNAVLPEEQPDNAEADRTEQEQPAAATETDEQGGSVLPEQTGSSGFTVEKRFHKKDNKNIYAVNFTERMERDAFLDAKRMAKNKGGYYSSFGKGSFIFETEEAANNFGELIMAGIIGRNVGRAVEKLYSSNFDKEAQEIRKKAGITVYNGARNTAFSSDSKMEGSLNLNDLGGIAETVDSHGLAKGNELEHLLYLLVLGVDPNRTFDTAPLATSEGQAVGAGLGTGSGHSYRTGLFIIASEPGGRLYDNGKTNIKTVLINDMSFEGGNPKGYEHAQNLKKVLSEQFPQIDFILYSEANDYYNNGSQKSAIEAARAEVDTNPTEAQKEAGNYKKGHVIVDGYNITLENPKGSERTGTDKNGNTWSVTMNNDYGYIRGTEGVDGDHIDVFLSDNPESGKVFVVDQLNEDGTFDEHKVMYGFDTRADAIEAYLANYSPGWTGLGDVTEVTKDQFKKWIDSSHRKTKPFAEYKSMITPKKPETVNGYKKGDKVMYQGKSATIYDFEYDGRPVLDTGLAPVIYTVAEWEDVTVDASLITGNFGKTLVNKAGDMEIRIGKYDGAKQAVSMKINGDVQTMPVREAINMLNTDEWSEKKAVEPKKVSVESIIENLNKRGQTKLSENVVLSPIETAKQPLQAEIDKRQKELADIKSGKKPNTVYGNGSNRSNLLEGEIREYKSRINNLDTLSSLKTGVAYEGEEGKKITIVSENNGVYKYQVEIDGHTVDLTANTEQMSNVVGLEYLSPERTVSTASETTQPSESAYGSQNKVVSTARYEELRKKLRSKLNNLNAGYDPELLQIGAEMAAYHVEAGARKFADFAKRMLADIGEEIRPYLKMFYNAVREFPGMESYEVEMDPYEEVRNTDINSIKLEEDEQTETNTETIVSEAETVASKAEADAAGTAEVKAQRLKEIDDALEKVNNQLALLGYYEADTDSPFHEAYGYAKSAEKKALADAKAFAKKLQKDLGVSTLKFESKRRKIASANIAPAGGDITLNIPLQDNSVLAMYIPMDIEPGTDNMYIRGGIMYRIEHGDDYTGETNHYINEKSDYPTMLNAIRRLAKRYLPEQQTDKPVSVPVRKAKKAESISPVGDLFAEEKEVSLEKETVNTIEDEQKRGSEKENLAVGTEARQEDAGPDRERMDTGSTGSTGTDQFGSGRAAVVSPVNGTRSTDGKRNERNNRNERGIDYAPKSPKARFDANVKAIRLMRKLIAADAVPTREQMQVLRKFSGWGGLGGYFNNEDSAEYKTLRELLSDEEFDAAANSINSAYYTPAHIIDTLWDVAAKLGFKGGNILEGSAGIGNIIGSMPVSISEKSNIEAVEIDPITGNILKLLYPDAKVNIQGFEDTRIRNGSVDLAITNVPFVTGLQVHDPIDKDLSRKFRNIHDFCIAKNVRKLREGGIGIFITSSGTMDKSTALREWLVNEGNADFVGAFRLNNKTFEGASVTSDIIVIRKRVGKAVSPAAIDAVNSSIVRTGEYPTGEKVWDKKSRSWVPEMKQTSMELNNYFQQHPENMAGEMEFAYEKGETRYPGSSALYPAKGKNQDAMLSEWADSFQPLMEKEYQPQPVEEIVTDEKNGSLFADEKGNFFVSEMGVGIPLNLNANKVRGYEKTECLADYNVLKSALNDVLSYQVDNQDDKGLEPLLQRLNEAYDNFTKKYGSLNKNVSISFLRNDVDFPSVAAIEDYKEYKNAKEEKVVEINKTEVFRGRVIGFQAEPQPKTVKDGVIASIYKFGHIDLNYISDKLGMDMEQVKNAILNEGLGFVNPETGAVDVRYEYLSGNVRKKLEQARENNQNGEFSENIKALEKVIPLDIPAHLIDFSLGSSWLDPQLYIDYIKDTYGVSDVTLNHVEGLWNMKVTGERNEKNRAAGVLSEKFNEVIYGTELVEAALNNRTIQVKKVITKYDKSKETVVDKEATQACMNRIEEIKDEFKEWMRNRMLQDEELAAKVAKTYNDKFNALVPVAIDEMFLPAHFGGSSEAVNLYTHQKRAVIRGTTEPLLLAHEVGSGKTFTLISTAMEMRRLGTAKKPMIVVQNATVGQFVADAKKLYPNAKILTISERDRTPEGRRAFYGRIKYSDWDLIIVPQSTFEMIPDSPERQLTFIQERIDEKMHALEVMKEIEADEMQIQQMESELVDLQFEYLAASQKAEEVKESKKRDRKREEKSKQNIAARAKEQLDRKVDEVEYFDQMGVDAILIDEAHEYKRLGFSTAMTRGVKGIDPSGSKKAAGVYLKTRVVLEQNGWKNVVFATGTPISNTAAEIWTFMRYLMPKSLLKENEIYYFDDFVRNFGSISQSLEFTTSGKFKENSRFASYINKPELIRLWSSISDTVLTKEISYVNDKIPALEKGQHQDIFLPQSDSLISIMRAVREKLEQFENMSGKEKRKNSHIPLTMYGIAKRAAIDTRLVDANAPDDPVSKTNKAVEETLRSLEETKGYKGTVAIFCDNQRRWDGNKVGFDLFEDIRDKLIARGVPAQQIVIMKPGMSVNKKLKIIDEVNAGIVRVVIGNTKTLGTGLNIHERLHTVIHMDAPDRPMDYTQRNGRILRQGNLHKVWGKPVRILRFGVEDSLDVTSYQRLKTKAAFIDSIMDGKAALANNQENRTLEEEEEGLFDNPVAILSGSQYALLKNQAEREYRKFLNKKSQYETDQIYVVNRLARNKGQINALSNLVQENANSLAVIRQMFPDGKAKVITIEGKKCRNAQEMEEAIKELINKKVRVLEDAGRKNANFGTQKLTFDVKFDNLDTKVNVTLTRKEDYDYKLKMSRITMNRYVTFDIPQLGMDDYSVLGGYARNAIEDIIDNVITGTAMSDSVDKLTSAIKGMEEENKLLEQRKGKPFEFENELAAARDKVDEYTELMKEEMREKEAKYANRGSEEVNLEDIEAAEEMEEEAPEENVRYRITEQKLTNKLTVDDVTAEAEKLGVPVTVFTSVEELPEGYAKRAIMQGRYIKGWYDIKTQRIHLFLPYATDIEDVRATLLHEGVGHLGLRRMVGEDNFNQFLNDVFDGASKKIRDEIVSLARKHGFNIRIATEEYLAEMAEKGIKEPTFWDKVKQLFRKLLEKIGYKWQITDNDLSYLLWENYYQLRQSQNPLHVAKETGMRAKMGIGEFAKREENETRFREYDFYNRPEIIKKYDAAIDSSSFRFQEAFQDSMLSLKVLQDTIIKETGKEIRTFENAYTAENRLSSLNKQDNERYMANFFAPLMDHVEKLSNKYGRERVEDYIYAKSGLERNEVILQRDANKELQESIQDLDKKLEKDEITQPQYDALVKTVQQRYNETIAAGGDFSGLTGLVQSKHQEELEEMLEEGQIDKAEFSRRMKEIGETYKDFAENLVAEFENDVPSAEVDQLWNLINAATHETLNKGLQSGMISREQYDNLKGMMKYYVPLKGWKEQIAENVYDYTRKEIPVQREKGAKGRKSLADNPIANIALSAQNAIILGNRNKMKQRFFNFVINRPNELAVIRDVWYARNAHTVHGQVEAVYPEIDETDDFEAIQQKLQDFEQRMKEMEANGEAFRGKVPFGLSLKTKKGQMPEHMVSVRINGQEYIIYINGNPRAAQALNGRTNSEGDENVLSQMYNKVKRFYGGGLTSNNPDFVLANFVRDAIHSTTMVYMDKGFKESAKFLGNIPMSFWHVQRGVRGKFNANRKKDVYFKEFVENGGETGYTAIHTLEDYKAEYDKMLTELKGFKKLAGTGKMAFEQIAKWLETANRIAEDVNRFNAYVSCREAGLSIEESIDAAKNITVNFNKKGALNKSKGGWAALAWFLNKWILFFNPSVQGIYQLGQTYAKNKGRVKRTLATILASGFLMPWLNNLFVSMWGDDDDDYFNQTDYTRMNNWLFWTGKGYIKIPLPPFFREVYGLGDILYRVVTGRLTADKAAVATLRQIQSAIGFINLIPNGEPRVLEAVGGLMPDLIAPLMDVAFNRDFMGRELAKDSEYTKNIPEYERIYKGVSPVYVEFSRMLNQIGGDDAIRNPFWGDFINPAYMEHIVTGYTGGVGRTISNLVGMIADAGTGNLDNIEMRSVPVANRFYNPINERTVSSAVNRVFYDYQDEFERLRIAQKRYKEFVKDGRKEFTKELEQMKKNGEADFIRYFSARMKTLRKKQDLQKVNPNNKKLEKEIQELKSEMIMESKKILSGK